MVQGKGKYGGSERTPSKYPDRGLGGTTYGGVGRQGEETT